MTPEPVRLEELPAAFALLFQRFESRDREVRSAAALDLVRRGELDSQGLFVLRRRSGLRAAVLAVALPGAAALVWPPQCVPSVDAASAEDALLHRAAAWLRGRKVKVAQALLAPEEVRSAAALSRNGFPNVTQLCFLRHDLHVLPRRGPQTALQWRLYDPAHPCAFHETLSKTYEHTLDCPELNGVRSVEEVVAAHRGDGRLHPGPWHLALADGEPVGVLLLASAETGEWEVSYVGVVPAARRRGFGRELTAHALHQAKAADASSLSLAVDARNRPAQQMYRGLGFEWVERREVFLAVWNG
ncbi:MAG TPA: GNAT family N-acetyltransferase [Gemmataceae bacterium]|nr:GNAT family N-acetyltransferase [Gemmataceae bacterium]